MYQVLFMLQLSLNGGGFGMSTLVKTGNLNAVPNKIQLSPHKKQ